MCGSCCRLAPSSDVSTIRQIYLKLAHNFSLWSRNFYRRVEMNDGVSKGEGFMGFNLPLRLVAKNSCAVQYGCIYLGRIYNIASSSSMIVLKPTWPPAVACVASEVWDVLVRSPETFGVAVDVVVVAVVAAADDPVHGDRRSCWMVDWKCRTWNWRTVNIVRHEIAGREIEGPNSKVWNCRTWISRTLFCKNIVPSHAK